MNRCIVDVTHSGLGYGGRLTGLMGRETRLHRG